MEPTPADDRLLREFLAAIDAPCPACGYNLRGLLAGACPECGAALRLQVGSPEARMGRYLAAVVGLATGGGAAMLLLAVVTGCSLYFGDWPPGELFVTPSMAAAVEGPALGFLLLRRGRVWFRQTSHGARSGLIVGAWVATLAWPLALLWVISRW